ncbi:hypothetical protein SCUP234_12573 [Seiridium cupressi]|uniref:Uncharacterized protein n=1 Tax=Seiridium unicorne TaxID=138068 RepID=A0ABR2V4K9_9PEZI
MSKRSIRPFSTISGVHPAYLPNLHRASRVEKKIVPAAIATVGIGYSIAKYKQMQADQQQAQLPQSTAQQQAESDAMMAAYGDRSSLAELEAAMKAYEEQRRER